MPLPRPPQKPSYQALPRLPQPQPQQPPQAQPTVHEVKIQLPSISLRFDDEFKARLPFLFLLILLFSFSLVMFEKSNFHAVDLVDFARVQYNLPKLYSISFILFMFLLSFSLALAMFFGFKQNWFVSLLVLPATVLPALVMSVFYPAGYFMPFIAFALTISAGSFIAAHRTQVKLSSIWGTAGAAFLLLVVLTFFVAFSTISANKDAYINTFIASGVTTSISQLSQGGTALGGGTGSAGSFQGIQITEDMIKNSITRDQIAVIISKERVDAALNKIPGWNSINLANRTAFAEDVRQQLIDGVYANVGKELANALNGLNTAQANASAPTPTPAALAAGGDFVSAKVKQILGQTPAFVVFYDNFALLMSVLIASIVSFFGFIMKIISTAVCWLLTKL